MVCCASLRHRRHHQCDFDSRDSQIKSLMTTLGFTKKSHFTKETDEHRWENQRSTIISISLIHPTTTTTTTMISLSPSPRRRYFWWFSGVWITTMMSSFSSLDQVVVVVATTAATTTTTTTTTTNTNDTKQQPSTTGILPFFNAEVMMDVTNIYMPQRPHWYYDCNCNKKSRMWWESQYTKSMLALRES